MFTANPLKVSCPYCGAVLRGGSLSRWLVFGVWIPAMLLWIVFCFYTQLAVLGAAGVAALLGGAVTISALMSLIVWWRGDFKHEKDVA